MCYIQDSSQIELLKELMDLLKDMVVMLLSMLEGKNVIVFQEKWMRKESHEYRSQMDIPHFQ